MKTTDKKNCALLPVPALLLALLSLLCSCTMAQSGALSRAYGSYAKGNYETAMKRLAEAETFGEMTDPRHAEVLLLKGRCLEGTGHAGEAVSLHVYLIKKSGTPHLLAEPKTSAPYS